MSDIQAAIQQAAGSIVDYRINDLWGHEGDIADLIRKAIMPAVEKQAGIIKHMIEDQCELESHLETLVGSTAQGDVHHMESIYDVVKRRWDELTAQLTIERAAHKTACEAVEQLKKERDEARTEAAAMREAIEMITIHGRVSLYGAADAVRWALNKSLDGTAGRDLLDELQRLRAENKQLRGE